MRTVIAALIIFCRVSLLGESIATYGLCKEITSEASHIKISESTIVVKGQSASVYKVVVDEGLGVFQRQEGECFNVVVENHTSVPTSLHWHGFILPNVEDGVSYVTQAPIEPGKSYPYNFKIVQSGSYFAHAHYGLQEQKLMNIPILLLPRKKSSYRDIVACFEDFTFQSIETVWQGLRKHYTEGNEGQNLMPQMSPQMMKKGPDLNDVTFDAYLCNRATLEHPPIYLVESGEEICLRLMNASTASGFLVTLGGLQGRLIAVDGQQIEPMEFHELSLATAQRMDVVVRIPKEGGVFAILAQGQGTDMLAGMILKTEEAIVPALSMQAKHTIGAITNEYEKQLKALQPLPFKPVDRTLTVELDGNMQNYVWSINQHVWPDLIPFMVKEGERVEMVFINKTGMSHPMHLHGHVFQITEIDGQKFSGAVRDTVLVMPHQTLKVQFDANNPGLWLLHCHIAYHAWAGMLSAIKYEGYDPPFFPPAIIHNYSRIYGGY